MKEKLEPIPVGRAENLIGQKFGHLTVLYRVANRTDRATWQCQCDCGTYFTAIGKQLKNGSAISCGCSTGEPKIKDRTNQRFGKLLVLKRSPNRATDGTILWTCQCDCGNIVDIRAGNLTKQKSCGKCFSGIDISGQRFGKLTAIKYHHTSSSKRSIWECQCDCGATSYVDITDLTSGKTKSCGCIKSFGEEKIAELLSNNNIAFEKQKTFETCRFQETNHVAYFDFYVNNEYLIEYDGVQHFAPIGGWNSEACVQENKKRDQEKNQWCKENNIPLIRIPYTKLGILTIEDLQLETTKYLI